MLAITEIIFFWTLWPRKRCLWRQSNSSIIYVFRRYQRKEWPFRLCDLDLQDHVIVDHYRKYFFYSLTPKTQSLTSDGWPLPEIIHLGCLMPKPYLWRRNQSSVIYTRIYQWLTIYALWPWPTGSRDGRPLRKIFSLDSLTPKTLNAWPYMPCGLDLQGHVMVDH